MRNSEALKRIADFLKRNDDFLLLTHKHPDGDCLGSALTLHCVLEKIGKRSCVCNIDEVPMYISMLPQEKIHNKTALPFKPKAQVFVDCSDAERAGCEDIFDKTLPTACIDHHATANTDFEAAYIDADAAAAGELVYDVMKELGVQPDAEIALYLYVAISTDSGNFSFSCTNRDTFTIAAECLNYGIDLDSLNYEMFRKRTRERTRLLGRALSGIRYLCGGRFALMILRQEDFEVTGAGFADTEGVVNYGIDTAGTAVAVLAVEQGDIAKFSFRSRGEVNVAKLARQFGGGGHERASGASIKGDFDAAVEQVMQACIRETGE